MVTGGGGGRREGSGVRSTAECVLRWPEIRSRPFDCQILTENPFFLSLWQWRVGLFVYMERKGDVALWACAHVDEYDWVRCVTFKFLFGAPFNEMDIVSFIFYFYFEGKFVFG